MSSPHRPRAGVVCVGSIVVDLIKVIDAYPAPERLATIDRVFVSTGGPALNMAVDLRRLGARFPVDLVGAVGDDEYGPFVLAECRAQGIGIAGVKRLLSTSTAFTDAMVERAGGRRTFFHHQGANALFDGSAVRIEESAARILHAGAPGIHPLTDRTRLDGGNGWSELLQRAQAAGLHTNLELVSLDGGRIVDVAAACLPHVDTLVINDWEAGALTGIEAPPNSADSPLAWTVAESMAEGLLDLGVTSLAVVHFPAGCVAAAPGGRTWRQGSVRLPPKEVLSTTGAGDAFGAGIVFGVHDGWPIDQCLRLAVASAAASVKGLGASEGITDATTCLAEADRVGHRRTTPTD